MYSMPNVCTSIVYLEHSTSIHADVAQTSLLINKRLQITSDLNKDIAVSCDSNGFTF